MPEDSKRPQGDTEAQEDLELQDEQTAGVVGGDVAYKPQKADGSLDAGIHFKYDLKAQKEG